MTSWRARVQATLELCRIPNVFTAMSNVVAGIVLARGGELHLGDMRVVLASALLYISGMVLNDFFDREIDALERPSRPIPSGRVSVSSALVFGIVLIVAALALLTQVGGKVLVLGGALALSILLYDAWLKNTPMGVVSMGLCRTLNVLLGLALVPWPEVWVWILPVAFGLYTGLITYLARDEIITQSMRRCASVAYSMLFLFIGFASALVLLSPAGQLPVFLMASPFLVFLAYRGVALFRPLLHDSSAKVVGPAIGGGILLMPGIDAAVLACAGYLHWALVALAMRYPAMWLKRRYYMT